MPPILLIQRLSDSSDAVLSLIHEIESLTGKLSRETETGYEKYMRAGKRSGARTITTGKWNLTVRFLFINTDYNLELLSSGILTGTGSWTIFKSNFPGRWHFDSSHELLQTNLSGGISKGMKSMAVKIIMWDYDYSATCQFQDRHARLRRIFG